MIIDDPVYGRWEVEEILGELIQSQPVQRLKKIHQGGAAHLVNPAWNVTRFEHSVGVMLLIRRLGGCLEEQIAGLLHDVSHTAFSHVVDIVAACPEDDFHDRYLETIVRRSEIPSLLKKHGFNLEPILDLSRWSLLEQPTPDLCADRIDYTLRDRLHYDGMEREQIQWFLDQLCLCTGKICLRSVEAAEWFAHLYYREVIDFFHDPLNLYAYEQLAHVLKKALEEGTLEMDDLFTDDETVLQQLRSRGSETVQSMLNQLHPGVGVKEDPEGELVHRRKKLRWIDPLIQTKNGTYRGSLLSGQIRNLNESAKTRRQRTIRLFRSSSTIPTDQQHKPG